MTFDPYAPPGGPVARPPGNGQPWGSWEPDPVRPGMAPPPQSVPPQAAVQVPPVPPPYDPWATSVDSLGRPVAPGADPYRPAYAVPAVPAAPPRRGITGGLIAGLVAGLIAGLVGGGAVVLADRATDDRPTGSAVSGRDVDTSAGDDPGAIPAPVLPPQDAGEVARIAALVLPSVVSVEIVSPEGEGSGSGFVIDSDGLILTNNHVIAGAVDSGTITVVFSGGSQSEAEIVGRDASYDLAVLRVARTGLPELELGDSDVVVVGQPVVAIGAPLGLASTVTTGIVSALNRPVAAGGDEGEPAFINAIQTDAAINPGNSGGPLVGLDGRVIGINSAIARIPGSGAGNVGLGFAIPSNQAQRTATQLIETGVATYPVVGILLDQTYTGEGVRVAEEAVNGNEPVTDGGPADKAGMQPGDIVLAIDDRPVTQPDELIVSIRALQPGDTVSLTVRRDDTVTDITVTLEAGGN